MKFWAELCNLDMKSALWFNPMIAEPLTSSKGSTSRRTSPYFLSVSNLIDGQMRLSQLAQLRGMHPDLIRRMIDNVSFIADHFRAMKKDDRVQALLSLNLGPCSNLLFAIGFHFFANSKLKLRILSTFHPLFFPSFHSSMSGSAFFNTLSIVPSSEDCLRTNGRWGWLDSFVSKVNRKWTPPRTRSGPLQLIFW